MGRFDGKAALITGGSSGIGLATAKALIQEGAKVAITGRGEKGLQAARLELGSGALVLRSDTSKLADLDALAAEVKARFGGLDVLFVNAGIAPFAPFEAVTEEAWDEIHDINLKGAFFTVQKIAPLLRKGSAVVLNTSVVGVKGLANTSVYSASKAGLRSLARTLATELLPRGIRVNAVSPGPIETPIFGKLGLSEAQRDGFAGTVPMKRFGAADEVARAVLFLASPESSFTTGAELTVDGGLAHL